MLRWIVLGIVCLVECVLSVSCASSCSSGNESRRALESVSVPVTSEASPGAEKIASQSYTIEQGDGDSATFVFSQTLESSVAYLGADADTLDEEKAKDLSLEPFTGVYVRKVVDKSPAEKAGLKKRDVIVSYGGKPTNVLERLQQLLHAAKPGDSAELVFLREGKESKATVILGGVSRFVSGAGMQRKLPTREDLDHLGIRVAELPPEVHQIVMGSPSAPKGVLVIETKPGTPAYFAELYARDLILEINGAPVPTVASFSQALAGLQVGTTAKFTILRGGDRLERDVYVGDDVSGRGGFNALGVIHYERSPSHRELSLLWSILWNYDKCYSVKVDDHKAQNESRLKWGMVLDLISFKSRSGGKKELRLLWFIPIWWGG